MSEAKEVFKGRANVVIYDNNDVDVRVPKENPDLKQTKICESKNGSISKSSNKVILKASVKSNETDLRSALIEEVNSLFGKLPDSSQSNIKMKNQGRWLVNDEGLKIRADSKDSQISILICLPLVKSQQALEHFYRKVSDVAKCLTKNSSILSKLT